MKNAKDRTEVLEKAQSLVEGEFFPRGAMPLAGGVGHAQAAIPWSMRSSFMLHRSQNPCINGVRVSSGALWSLPDVMPFLNLSMTNPPL